jgi:hypothetical protein
MLSSRTNTLIILPLAGPITRFLAWAIDLGTIIAIISILNAVLGILGIISRDFAMAANIIGFFVVSIGYGILTEWYWNGQRLRDFNGVVLEWTNPGKKAFAT